MLPEWAAGFWQSKLRYRTQEELLEVAREYHRRGLPLSVIVSDFFHWTQLGDWRFEPSEWPDPQAMVDELAAMGVRLMVSVWPSVSVLSSNYQPMLQAGYLIASERGAPIHADWPDRHAPVRLPVAFYDATNPGGSPVPLGPAPRQLLRVPGSRSSGSTPANLRSSPATSTTSAFPQGQARRCSTATRPTMPAAIYEGMHEAGETEVVSLIRSAWAGSQRWGAALWSGDIPATFESLAAQVRAGLNVAVSGIPWWTTDIGGFHGGDPEKPRLPGAHRALVRVRRVVPAVPPPRGP